MNCIIIVVTVSAFFFLLNVFSNNESFHITGIAIHGLEGSDENVVHDQVRAILQSKGFPNYSNTYFTPRSLIREEILKKNPLIKEASVSIKDKILTIETKQREPEYVWCYPESETLLDEKCYFFDSSGVIFADAPVFTGGLFNKISTPKPPVTTSFIGKLFAQPSEIAKYKILFSLGDIFSNNKTSVSWVNILNRDELHVYIKDLIDTSVPKDSYIIIRLHDLDTLDDLRLKFKVLVKSKIFSDELHKMPQNFQYLDLRFKNRLYYRFKKANEAKPDITISGPHTETQKPQ